MAEGWLQVEIRECNRHCMIHNVYLDGTQMRQEVRDLKGKGHPTDPEAIGDADRHQSHDMLTPNVFIRHGVDPIDAIHNSQEAQDKHERRPAFDKPFFVSQCNGDEDALGPGPECGEPVDRCLQFIPYPKH